MYWHAALARALVNDLFCGKGTVCCKGQLDSEFSTQVNARIKCAEGEIYVSFAYDNQTEQRDDFLRLARFIDRIFPGFSVEYDSDYPLRTQFWHRFEIVEPGGPRISCGVAYQGVFSSLEVLQIRAFLLTQQVVATRLITSNGLLFLEIDGGERNCVLKQIDSERSHLYRAQLYEGGTGELKYLLGTVHFSLLYLVELLEGLPLFLELPDRLDALPLSLDRAPAICFLNAGEISVVSRKLKGEFGDIGSREHK